MMIDNKARPLSIDELCKNKKFENDGETIFVNNSSDLLRYINKINEKAITFTQKNSGKDIDISEEAVNKFIFLFEYNNNYLFYTSPSKNIINTLNVPNDIIMKINNNYNNVFILNKILENEENFCFEIKLGHGLWNNINEIKNKHIDVDNTNNDYQMNAFKVGFLSLNEESMKTISDNIVISELKDIKYKVKWDSTKSQEHFDNLCIKYANFKKNIYYCVDLKHLIFPMNKRTNDSKKSRLIQKNDVIGIVIKAIKGNVVLKIFINGILVNCQILEKQDIIDENNYSDIDDNYSTEKENDKKIGLLIPFIELGQNCSIFIKDKPNDNNSILSIEKMEYYDKYHYPPLNKFCELTNEIKKITDNYLDILIKVGIQIFSSYPNEINKYFKQLITFFNKYTFRNIIIIKNEILSFLTNGINLENSHISQFKNNLKFLFYMIKNDSTGEVKFELILSLFVEFIIENNFNLLNEYNLNEIKTESTKQIQNLKKNKFILCFLLFDNFMKEECISNYFNKELYINNENNYMNFCYAVFNSCFYKDSTNALDYIKKFYVNNYTFDKKKFMEYNFNKTLTNNNQDYSDKLIYEFIQDYKFIINNLINNSFFQNNKEQFLFFKFIINFVRSSDDNISIINGILINLIQGFIESVSTNVNLDEVKKFLKISYLNEKTNKCIPKNNENTFFGKYNYDDIKQKYSSILNININQKEINDYLIFELILNCLSNYYQKFTIKEKNAKYYIELLNGHKNSIDYYTYYKVNEINDMIEFYQILFTGKFYMNIVNYEYYLLKIMELCITNNYFDILPYKPYLNNLLFILDYLDIRCCFIDKKNLIDKSEPKIISSIIELGFKYVTEFLGKNFSKVRQSNFKSTKQYEELVSLHIKILIKILHFDVGAIKHSLPEVKDNLILLFKNTSEIYEKSYKILYNDINALIEYLYYFEENKECINQETKKMFFKNIMAKEIEEFSKMKNEGDDKKDTYIRTTMYFNIFNIIYERSKNVRNSLDKVLNINSFFTDDLLYKKKYILKYTQIMSILLNFLKENPINMFYDTKCTLFLKINSFIIKTFKVLYKEKVFEDLKKISEKNKKLMDNFYTQFFFLLSILLLSKNEQFDYNYKIAKNRKGFYFNEFKQNFNKFFGAQDYKMMNEFLDILSDTFKHLCDDGDTLKAEDVDDNSIEMDKRDSCPICLEYTNENDVHLNDCNHQYHLECLKKQISNNLIKCSLCKRPITGIKEDPNFKVNSNVNSNDLFSPRFGGNRNVGFNIFANENNSLFSQQSLFSPRQNSNLNTFNLFEDSHIRPSTGGLFANNNRNGSPLFSTNNNNNINTTSIFGFNNNRNEGGLFSNNNNGNTTGLFGNNSLNTANNSLFGNNNNANTGLFLNINSNNSLFGNNSSGRGLFG